jgi:hypothetical protein
MVFSSIEGVGWLKILWLIGRYVLVYWWGMLRLNSGHVLAHLWEPSGSFVVICWLIDIVNVFA